MINDIRDQSNCGCCWAFAAVGAASDRMCITTNGTLMMPLSAQDVCFNSNSNGCGGGSIDTPWDYMNEDGGEGVVTGGQYQGSGPFGQGYCSDFSLPHCHHHGPTKGDPYPPEGILTGCPKKFSPRGPKRCDKTASSEHSNFDDDKYVYKGRPSTALFEHDIKQFIMEGGPCEAAFTVYSDFENYDTGIYHHVTGKAVGGHAVRIVGWGVEKGVKYWKVANSWNKYWGESGFFRIQVGDGDLEAGCIASSTKAVWHKKSQAVVG